MGTVSPLCSLGLPLMPTVEKYLGPLPFHSSTVLLLYRILVDLLQSIVRYSSAGGMFGESSGFHLNATFLQSDLSICCVVYLLPEVFPSFPFMVLSGVLYFLTTSFDCTGSCFHILLLLLIPNCRISVSCFLRPNITNPLHCLCWQSRFMLVSTLYAGI
jgi:hypothetical protein